MFERFIILTKARRALQSGRHADALRHADAPAVRQDRRAESLRAAALRGMLDRARRRADAGDLSGAMADAKLVLAHAADHMDARDLLTDVQRRSAEAGEAAKAVGSRLAEARALVGRGRLAEALARAGTEPAIAALVAERRQQAEACGGAALAALRAGDADSALRELAAADTIDHGFAARWQHARAFDEALGRDLGERLRQALADGDLDLAVAHWRRRIQARPDVAATPDAGRAVQALVEALTADLRRAAVAGGETVDAAVHRVLLVQPVPAGAAWQELAAAAADLRRVAEHRRRGEAAALADGLRQVADRLGVPELRREAASQAEAAAAVDARLAAARVASAAGDLAKARAELVAVLERWPLHEQARAELALIDQGARDRADRLAAARARAQEGRLQDACAQALALAVAGPAGDEARLLVVEVRARMDLVQKGLDQVKAALHGRDGGSAEGVRHCQARLQELAKVQTDHPEVQRLLTALGAELDYRTAIDEVGRQLAEAALPAAAAGFADLLEQRGGLWAPARVDARLQAQGEDLLRGAEAALAAGRLDDLATVLGPLSHPALAATGLGPRAAAVAGRADERRRQAEARAAAAREALAARDLDRGASLLAEARQLWAGVPDGRRVQDDLVALRRQEAALARVEALAGEKDFAGAHHHLNDLPPTPALLRTRIFDLKQELARAQGLEGPFLLRVDEGGEFLVLRGEVITIGNVRDGTTDLPILASIAGRHARIERKMSFHGGLVDTVFAQEGEVRLGGAAVPEHRLRAGDRIHLGRSLSLTYQVPSSRSLTACLTLGGGFQVAGTDRILLLKDRGRDGRILLGAGKDAHVRLPNATGEIEVFAHKTGQIRVRSSSPGTIDGRPFSGEHPVDPGAVVCAAGISFVLMPWHRPR